MAGRNPRISPEIYACQTQLNSGRLHNITDKDSWKIESIQRRAARWAKSTYSPRTSIIELLQELGWDDLSNRRKNLRLTLVYKIYYHQVAVDYAELDITCNPRLSRQHEHQIRQLPARKNTFLFSFVMRTILEWNSLPANTISADSAITFKSQLHTAPPWAAPPHSRVGHLWHLGTNVQIQIQIQTHFTPFMLKNVMNVNNWISSSGGVHKGINLTPITFMVRFLFYCWLSPRQSAPYDSRLAGSTINHTNTIYGTIDPNAWLDSDMIWRHWFLRDTQGNSMIMVKPLI